MKHMLNLHIYELITWLIDRAVEYILAYLNYSDYTIQKGIDR